MHHCQASINCSYFINREIKEESKLYLAIEKSFFHIYYGGPYLSSNSESPHHRWEQLARHLENLSPGDLQELPGSTVVKNL